MPGRPEISSKETPPPAVETGNSSETARFVARAIEDHQSQLIGYANSLLHDLHAARDVVQDTFLKLCQQDPDKVRDNLKPWLFTVCRNRALDVLRKDKRIEPLEDVRWKKVAGPDLQPDEHAEAAERRARLAAILRRLTDNQREVILLKFQQNLSYREIEKITGLRAGNIGFLSHTGLKRLREILPDDLREPPPASLS
jgi:RNA polymerase sigma-70 factor (ECF subfamily)